MVLQTLRTIAQELGDKCTVFQIFAQTRWSIKLDVRAINLQAGNGRNI
jgi:hypothetical protein